MPVGSGMIPPMFVYSPVGLATRLSSADFPMRRSATERTVSFCRFLVLRDLPAREDFEERPERRLLVE